MSNADRFRSLAFVLIVMATSVPAVVASAQEGVGSFRVVCAPALAGAFDPIVFPGESPVGHHHEFYGSTRIGPSSNPQSLLGTATTCSDTADSSGYWHPTLYVDGVRTPASLVSVYYTQRTPRKPSDLAVVPAGLRVVSGDMHAASPQNDEQVWWDCDGVEMGHQPTAPTCPTASRGLEANVRFPDCWDGVNLDSADHKSHMSYSTNNDGTFVCDAAHPIQLPHVQMIIRWDGLYVPGESITLASGSTMTLHADFMNAWRQDRLSALQDTCIRTRTECGRIESGTPASAATSPATTLAVATTAPTAHHPTPAAGSESSRPTVAVDAHHPTEGAADHSSGTGASGSITQEPGSGSTSTTVHEHSSVTTATAKTVVPAASRSNAAATAQSSFIPTMVFLTSLAVGVAVTLGLWRRRAASRI